MSEGRRWLLHNSYSQWPGVLSLLYCVFADKKTPTFPSREGHCNTKSAVLGMTWQKSSRAKNCEKTSFDIVLMELGKM